MQTFYLPTQITTGNGCFKQLGQTAARFGKSALLVCDQHLAQQTDVVERAREYLGAAGLEMSVYADVAREPELPIVAEGIRRANDADATVIIGIGGGSAMDTAKGVGVLAFTGDDDPAPYQRFGSKTVPGCVPNIAIPTTSGTGSEVTSVCVLTTLRTGHKLPIRHPSLLPRVALVDPRLMLSMPPKVTAATGIDALSHATECFTLVREHPFADTLALEATRLIVENLPRAVANGQDIEARTNMALAATMAGSAFEVGGLQFHAYAQALGAKYHAAHGVTCGIALRAGFQQILPIATKKLARMAPAFGVDTRGLGEAQAAERGVAAAIAFINAMGIPKATEAMPVTAADIPMLKKETLETTASPIAPEVAQAVWEKILSGK